MTRYYTALDTAQLKAHVLIGDEISSKSSDVFPHRRNASCVVLMYMYIVVVHVKCLCRYIWGKCRTEEKGTYLPGPKRA